VSGGRPGWDARFAVSDVGEPGPPTALAARLDLLPDGGRALDVACGRGTVAVWLAQAGFVVDAVDASPSGLALGTRLAEREGVAVRWIEADLTDGLPVEGRYDVVVCQRYRDPVLYPALFDVLAPGGLLVLTVLSVVGDAGGRFRAAAGELLAAFGGLDVVVHSEGRGEATLVAVRPAPRVGPPTLRR